MEYHIVWAMTYPGLIKEVNTLLKEGWKLQGGVCVSYTNGCYQALYKEIA